MRKTIVLISVIVSLCEACQSPAPTTVPTPTQAPTPAIVSATGYRPIQAGDVVASQCQPLSGATPSIA